MNRFMVALVAAFLTLSIASTAVAAGGGYITGDLSSTVVARPSSPPPVYATPAPVVQSAPVSSPCCTPTITNYAPAVVMQPRPVVTYRPVITGQPVYVAPRHVTAYAPVVAGPRYVTAYSPIAAPAPVVYGQPVIYGRPVVVRTKVYVPGQPIRNALRWIAP